MRSQAASSSSCMQEESMETQRRMRYGGCSGSSLRTRSGVGTIRILLGVGGMAGRFSG